MYPMNNIKEQKVVQRNSNLELYRILVMLSIVAHHYVVNSGVLEVASESPTSFRSIYYYLMGAWGKTGINCFVLITGYFMCKSEITLQKFLKLLFQVIFYMVMVNAVLVGGGKETLSRETLLSDLQLLFDVSYCFTSCFIFFYLFIPFLNILVNNMTQKQHKYLVILCLIVYTGISTLKLGEVSMNYVVWFCILYFISSYIRLYGLFQRLHWGLVVGGALFFAIASIMVTVLINGYFGKDWNPYHLVSDSNKLLAVVLSVSLFMFFKDLRIPQSKWINRIAQSCFGVLLIHANSDAMRQWLWGDLLNVSGQYYNDTFILHSLLSVFGIYMVCTVIDQLRIYYVERPLFQLLKSDI